MRFIPFIAVVATVLATEASVSFDEARDYPDLGLALPIFSDAQSEPLELPRAESYIVGLGGAVRLEDRYSAFELWMARVVRGRWSDMYGNEMLVARIDVLPPASDEAVTRVAFENSLRKVDVKSVEAVAEVTKRISSVELGKPVRPRRSKRRNFVALYELPSTNSLVRSFMFRPKPAEEKQSVDWYFVQFFFDAAENADVAYEVIDGPFLDAVRTLKPGKAGGVGSLTETELLRRDVAKGVVNYEEWHVTDSRDVTVADNLLGDDRLRLITNLTNSLPLLRREYARRFPSPLADTNRLAVVRVFDDKNDYIDYAGEAMAWSAAYWSPIRRELVAYIPAAGTDALLRTLRHESFHQYLSYACAMRSAAPWLNEGHAELFEHGHFNLDGEYVFEKDVVMEEFVRTFADKLSERIPLLMKMDYAEFYAGSDMDRYANYVLAWSIAYFLETGAPELRLKPYDGVRRDYVAEIVRSGDMHKATQAAFPKDCLEKFVADWYHFWRE